MQPALDFPGEIVGNGCDFSISPPTYQPALRRSGER